MSHGMAMAKSLHSMITANISYVFIETTAMTWKCMSHHGMVTAKMSNLSIQIMAQMWHSAVYFTVI